MDRCQGKLTAASEGSLSGIIIFCDVQALNSQAVLISSLSTAVIRRVPFCAVQLIPIHSPWPGPVGLFFPEFSGVLLHARVLVSRLRARQAEGSLQRISLAWEDLQARPELPEPGS